MCTSPGWIRPCLNVIILFGICFCFANMQCDHFYCQFTTSSFKRLDVNITKTRLFKYTENFNTKNENFQIKNSDIFHISAQNMDCGYSLEPPRRGGSNEYHNLCF